MRQIEEFADDIRSGRSPVALDAVATFSGALYQANQFNELRDLEALFPRLARANPRFRNNLMEALMLVVMQPDPRTHDIELFEDLRRAAWEDNFGETALAFDLLLHYDIIAGEITPEHVEKGEVMLRRAGDFRDVGKILNFLNVFGALLKPETQARVPSAVHHEISEVARKAFDNHVDSLSEIATEEMIWNLKNRGGLGADPFHEALVEAGKL